MKLSDSRWLAVYGTDAFPVSMGMANCNPKLAVAFILRLHSDLEAALESTRTMLDSIRCGEPQIAVRPQAAVKFPAGFGRVSERIVQRYRSLGGENIGISYVAGDMFEKPEYWRRAVTAVEEQDSRREIQDDWTHEIDIAERADLRPARMVRIDIPGQPGALYMGSLHCEDAELTFMARIALPEPDDALAERRLSQVDCPRDGAPDLPPFDKIAAAACSRGEARACEIARQMR